MKRLIPILLCALLIAGCGTGDKPLPRAKDFNINTSNFSKCFSTVENNGVDELHSLMVLKDGCVVYEEYDTGHTPDELHVLWSASKTFTAAAVGLAVQDGLLSVDDKIVDLFDADELPAHPGRWLRELTVKHLLTMSSGFSVDYLSALRSGNLEDPTRTILSTPIKFRPGEKWEYNSMNTYLLSAIVTRVTGRKVVDIVADRLFKPMGINRYVWEESCEGVSVGGWGLYLTTESFAKMGQLLLDGGKWDGEQLLDAGWVKDMMSPQIMQYAGRNDIDMETLRQMTANDDWNLGYGYQMWCCQHSGARLDGAWGQYCLIAPEKNAVMVVTAHASNNKAVFNTLWDYVYPAL